MHANEVDTRELALRSLAFVGFPEDVADAVRRIDVLSGLSALEWIGVALRMAEGRLGVTWGWSAIARGLGDLPEEGLC